jgi:hypothetical protein
MLAAQRDELDEILAKYVAERCARDPRGCRNATWGDLGAWVWRNLTWTELAWGIGITLTTGAIVLAVCVAVARFRSAHGGSWQARCAVLLLRIGLPILWLVYVLSVWQDFLPPARRRGF